MLIKDKRSTTSRTTFGELPVGRVFQFDNNRETLFLKVKDSVYESKVAAVNLSKMHLINVSKRQPVFPINNVTLVIED